MTYRAPKGTDDILPPHSRAWVRAERAFLDLAEQYGYGLTMTPLFEATELFSRGVGEATEVVEKQMYTFDDKGGRSLTLRPEATASVVRAASRAGTPGCSRARTRGRCSATSSPTRPPPPVLPGRGRVPRRGRRRMPMSRSSSSDIALGALGVTRRRGAAQLDRGPADGRLPGRSWSPISRSGSTAVRRRQAPDASNPLRVLDSKADVDVVADAPAPIDHLGAAAADHFAGVGMASSVSGSRIGSSHDSCVVSTTTTAPSWSMSAGLRSRPELRGGRGPLRRSLRDARRQPDAGGRAGHRGRSDPARR